ncbi:MAG: ribonuclease H-like domain-containing protein [Ignavibacteria bacterium]
MKLVFDIETVGYDFESLHESQQELLLRYVEKEKDEELRREKKDEAIRYLNLYPFTARIVSIAMMNTETENTLVLFEGENDKWEVKDDKIKYESHSEEKIIKLFWKFIKKADQAITFNGRMFDIPFLMLRSAILRIKPSVNLLGNRYYSTTHVDLLEQFTFHGLMRKFNLDFYCRAFGIESPKSKEITGMEVNELYRAGRIKDIAIYNGKDVKATYELYKIWDEHLNF